MTIPAFARRRSPLSFSLACLAASVALLAACGKGDDSKAAANPAQQAMPVTVIRVTSRPVPISQEAVGQAEGSREVEIRARVNGILERRLYQEGAPVAAGGGPLRIHSAPVRLSLAPGPG